MHNHLFFFYHLSSTTNFFGFLSTITACFLVLVMLKIVIWLFGTINTNALCKNKMLLIQARTCLKPNVWIIGYTILDHQLLNLQKPHF